MGRKIEMRSPWRWWKKKRYLVVVLVKVEEKQQNVGNNDMGEKTNYK